MKYCIPLLFILPFTANATVEVGLGEPIFGEVEVGLEMPKLPHDHKPSDSIANHSIDEVVAETEEADPRPFPGKPVDKVLAPVLDAAGPDHPQFYFKEAVK